MGRIQASVSASLELPRQSGYCYEGAARPDALIQFYGMFGDYSSIPNVCLAFARGLRDRVPALALQSYLGGVREPTLQPLAGMNPRAPIAFFYGIPEAVEEPVLAHGTRIIGVACETDRVTRLWVARCNAFDLVVVPSRYCARSLRDSGVEAPILVVPHGLEPCYRPVRAKPRRDPFVFYNVVNGQRPHRKGLPELFRAFRRAFPDRRDVVLRLRTKRSFPIRSILAAERVRDDDPRFEIDERCDLPTDAFAAYYSDVHCTVHPSRAEGFGLIPFQSIACETPVIAPDSTGMRDYLDETNAMLLRTRGQTTEPDVYYRCGTQPLVDEDHLVELLRHAEAHWEAEYTRLREVAPRFRERHTWDRALGPFLNLVGALAELSDPRARAALIRERVA